MTVGRPAIFVGSSAEGLDVAYALQENLEYDCEPIAYHRTMDAAPPATSEPDRTDYFVTRWNDPALTRARDTLRAGIPLHALEDDEGQATAALQSLFAFLESFADSLLSGEIDEKRARPIFETPVKNIWDRASTYLAPLNLAAEWWDPPPKLSILAQRWSQQ